jgi:hypothetical protein
MQTPPCTALAVPPASDDALEGFTIQTNWHPTDEQHDIDSVVTVSTRIPVEHTPAAPVTLTPPPGTPAAEGGAGGGEQQQQQQEQCVIECEGHRRTASCFTSFTLSLL